MDHLDDASLSEWCDDDIEEKKYPKSDQNLSKVSLMSEVCESGEKYILFLEHYHIGKCYLIHDHEKEPQHPDERRKKIEFLQ
jgi:hypothetical protein